MLAFNVDFNVDFKSNYFTDKVCYLNHTTLQINYTTLEINITHKPRMYPNLGFFISDCKMPRKFRPKNLRETDRTNLELAFKYRVEHQTSIRKAAQEFGVKVMTLQVNLLMCKPMIYEEVYKDIKHFCLPYSRR